MRILPIKDADITLVELKPVYKTGRLVPHCKKHGAMLKLTSDGIWRCMTTYTMKNVKGQRPTDPLRIMGNNCSAGCQEEKVKDNG